MRKETIALLILTAMWPPYYALAQQPVLISAPEVQGNIHEFCCTQGMPALRRKCLVQTANRLQGLRGLLGDSFTDGILLYIRNMKDSDCNNPKRDDPEETPKPTPGGGRSCDVKRAISDGPGGFLHKGISDTTGAMVDLFPAGQRADSCRYENKAGRRLVDLIYRGDSNPNRPTWRPAAGGYCSAMPSPVILNCRFGTKNHCWTIPQPCARYD